MKKLGKILFKYRGYTPVPLLIILALVVTKRYPFQGYWNELSDLAGLAVAILGEVIRLLAVVSAPKGTSGREIHLKADSLRTSGIYAYTRNPLYLANFIIGLGFCIVVGVWWVYIAYLFLFAFQYRLIIAAEEHFLLEIYGNQYIKWAGQVPRFFPTFAGNPYKNQNSPEKISIKGMVMREQDTTALIFLAVLFWKLWEHLCISGFKQKQSEITGLLVMVGAVLVLWFVLRVWKKGWFFFKERGSKL
ncbi:hypothetical protein JW877_06875 [bacterium]|nr:hypothetical protein [bacterium]